MSVMNRNMPLATSAVAPPSLLTQVGMAGTAAVITVRTSDGNLFFEHYGVGMLFALFRQKWNDFQYLIAFLFPTFCKLFYR